jgi:molybdopterin synthase catalytic subunit
MPKDIILLTDQSIHIEKVVSELSQPDIGAVATFVGVVRKDSDCQKAGYVEYKADPEAVLPGMQQICTQIKNRWSGITRIAIVHRIGRLNIGDIIVLIAVSAAHRQHVFDALHYAIDKLRKSVPISKKEIHKEDRP